MCYCNECTRSSVRVLKARLRDSLLHQRAIKSTAAHFSNLVTKGYIDSSPELQAHILRLQVSTDELGELLSQPPNLDLEVCSRSRSSIAERVFCIPELLEITLLGLGLVGALRMRLVSKRLKAVVDSSTVLQRQLLQEPDQTAFHTIPIGRGVVLPNNFKIDQTYQLLDRDDSNIASHEQDATRFLKVTVEGYVPQFGAGWMNTLICQPPIAEMTVSASCCSQPNQFYTSNWRAKKPPSLANLVEPSGIRIRHICDYARQLMDEHALCPNARSSELRDDGTVIVNVVFETNVLLREGDPMLEERRIEEEGSKRSSGRKIRMLDYCMYKRRCESASSPGSGRFKVLTQSPKCPTTLTC